MLHRIIAKSYSIVTIIKVWSNVKRVRKNQISFEDIYIPLDTSRYQTRARTNFFFAMNRRIVRKIETRMMSGLDTWKTIAFVQSRGSASSSLNPYPRTTHSCMNYLLRGIIVSTNGVIRTFHGTVRAESRNCSHELRSPCPGLGSRKSQVTRLVGSAHSRSNRLLSAAVLSFASPPTRSRYVGVAKRELFALLRFNVPGSGCRRSISPGTMVTRSVIRHACIRRFAISTGLYIYIYIWQRGFPLLLFLITDYFGQKFHTLSLSIM